MISVLITDDHPVVRKGIRQILEEDPEERFGNLAEAGNGNELIEILQLTDFDVVLLDISMPGKSGLELLSDIKKWKPDIKVLILSMYPEEQYAQKALKLGASGYLTKESAPGELIDALVKTSVGGKYISSSLAEKITFNLLADTETPIHEKLSGREMEVIELLAKGKTMSSIAEELSLSPKTISTYRVRILSKLKLQTTSDLIRYAIKEGLSEDC